jgi:hypothetical protein
MPTQQGQGHLLPPSGTPTSPLLFGQVRVPCECCEYCHSLVIATLQNLADKHIQVELKNGKVIDSVLRKLAERCLVCMMVDCPGFPNLWSKSSTCGHRRRCRSCSKCNQNNNISRLNFLIYTRAWSRPSTNV